MVDKNGDSLRKEKFKNKEIRNKKEIDYFNFFRFVVKLCLYHFKIGITESEPAYFSNKFTSAK